MDITNPENIVIEYRKIEDEGKRLLFLKKIQNIMNTLPKEKKDILEEKIIELLKEQVKRADKVLDSLDSEKKTENV